MFFQLLLHIPVPWKGIKLTVLPHPLPFVIYPGEIINESGHCCEVILWVFFVWFCLVFCMFLYALYMVFVWVMYDLCIV